MRQAQSHRSHSQNNPEVTRSAYRLPNPSHTATSFRDQSPIACSKSSLHALAESAALRHQPEATEATSVRLPWPCHNARPRCPPGYPRAPCASHPALMGGVVRQVHPVEDLPKVWVMDPHALQGGVQLVVPFGLGEPLQSLLLGQVVAFAHGQISLRSSASSYRAQERWGRDTPIPMEQGNGHGCELRLYAILKKFASKVVIDLSPRRLFRASQGEFGRLLDPLRGFSVLMLCTPLLRAK